MKTLTTGGRRRWTDRGIGWMLSLKSRLGLNASATPREIEAKMLNKAATKRKLTRREQRDLDVEISFMEGVVRREPGCVEAWRVLMPSSWGVTCPVVP